MDKVQGTSECMLGELPRCWQRRPDVPAATFLLPKRFIEVGSLGLREQRQREEFPQGQRSLCGCYGVLAFQPLLHHRVSASEMTVRSAQGQPCVRKLSAPWPPKGSCNPPLIQRDPGVERDPRASESPVGPPARRQIPEEPSKFVAKTQPLSAFAETVFWVKEKKSFVAFSGKGGHNRLMP